MKTKAYYKLSKSEEIYSGLAALLINFVWYIPTILLIKEIEISIFSIAVSFLLFCIFLILWGILIVRFDKKQQKRIEKRIEQEREQHIKDFFDFLEQDEQFISDNFHFQVQMYDRKREKVGINSVYTNLMGKKQEYFKTLKQ